MNIRGPVIIEIPFSNEGSKPFLWPLRNVIVKKLFQFI